MNPKGFINIVVVIGVVILVGMAGYFVISQKASLPGPILPPTPKSTHELFPTTKGTPKINSKCFPGFGRILVVVVQRHVHIVYVLYQIPKIVIYAAVSITSFRLKEKRCPKKMKIPRPRPILLVSILKLNIVVAFRVPGLCLLQ